MKKLLVVAMVLPALVTLAQAADFDGEGTDDIGIFRPSAGLWAVRGVTRIYFGGSGDNPAPGDYNGDGTDDIAINRPGTFLWAVRGVTRVYFGSPTDIPLGGEGGRWLPSGNNIYYNVGYVGIGTTSPSQKFHIASPSSSWGMMRLQNTSPGNNECSISFVDGSGGYTWLLGPGGGGDAGSFVIYRIGSASTFLIDSDGNVEVGTALKVTLPKTGQTWSYRTGDDGYLEKGQAVLVDNGDGTVTDSRTGLMWPKDGTGAGYYSGGIRLWYQAIDWANDLNFAGYTDWQLPNINELKSFQEVTWGHYQNQPTGYCWSSTTSPSNTLHALHVNFSNGVVSTVDKLNGHYVVAVRGGL